MKNRMSALAVVAFCATSLTPLANVASAMPFDVHAIKNAAPTDIDAVRYYGWGWGVGAALVGGAIVGGMLAAPYYYGPGPYYRYGYGPGPYYRYGYGPGPYYGYEPQYGYGAYYRASGYGGDAVAYCTQRFRSYDVRSGTYVGYDGYRHPCP